MPKIIEPATIVPEKVKFPTHSVVDVTFDLETKEYLVTLGTGEVKRVQWLSIIHHQCQEVIEVSGCVYIDKRTEEQKFELGRLTQGYKIRLDKVRAKAKAARPSTAKHEAKAKAPVIAPKPSKPVPPKVTPKPSAPATRNVGKPVVMLGKGVPRAQGRR